MYVHVSYVHSVCVRPRAVLYASLLEDIDALMNRARPIIHEHCRVIREDKLIGVRL